MAEDYVLLGDGFRGVTNTEPVAPLRPHEDIVAWPGKGQVDSAEAAEPPEALSHECKWVLAYVETVQRWCWSKTQEFYVCECGEAKVVEYEV